MSNHDAAIIMAFKFPQLQYYKTYLN